VLLKNRCLELDRLCSIFKVGYRIFKDEILGVKGIQQAAEDGRHPHAWLSPSILKFDDELI
jgi:hypothetical protein